MKLDRRKFIKFLGVGSVSALVGTINAAETKQKTDDVENFVSGSTVEIYGVGGESTPWHDGGVSVGGNRAVWLDAPRRNEIYLNEQQIEFTTFRYEISAVGSYLKSTSSIMIVDGEQIDAEFCRSDFNTIPNVYRLYFRTEETPWLDGRIKFVGEL